MADIQQYYQQDHQDVSATKERSSSHILALATLLPFGASLLFLAGVTLLATLIGVALATPLFIIFSPILIPAALVIAFSVSGFLTSGAFGVTSVSSFAWMASYLRRSRLQESLLHAKDRAQQIMSNMAQRAKEAGATVVSEAQDTAQQAHDAPTDTDSTVSVTPSESQTSDTQSGSGSGSGGGTQTRDTASTTETKDEGGGGGKSKDRKKTSS
ncbi:oleosin H2 [Arachis duranensis]|uniref:Oleosin n=2 Tax=Arachis TaxID=3817 RepID=A0A445EPH4_ARAHY|nr:oleosin H2 [Arachis duranensis]XP_025604283.1 oleosin 16.4 kDa [Arachis hypogaea]ALB24768.1 Oleosin [Arachis hypogaea]RYR77375.1 hypothetical protein Ahy_A01g001806 [Arachis hypogaea]